MHLNVLCQISFRDIEITLFAHPIIDEASIQGFSLNNIIQGVFAHELGHSLGLKDNPSTTLNLSLMNQDRNRNIVTEPTSFDAISVNMLYLGR